MQVILLICLPFIISGTAKHEVVNTVLQLQVISLCIGVMCNIRIWWKSLNSDMEINPNSHFVVGQIGHMWYFSASTFNSPVTETVYGVKI